MRRVNTASSFFKRLLSRNDSQSQPHTPAGADGPPQIVLPGNSGKMPKSASNASLAGSKILPVPGRITDQVIEEVDEQMTITSMRQEVRPKAEDLFSAGPMTSSGGGPPPPSKPVDVPMRSFGVTPSTYNRAFSTVGQNLNDRYMENNDFLSTSAPTNHFRPVTPQGYDEHDRNKEGGGECGGDGQGDDDADEFERLRLARERERNERQRLNIARSISTTQGSNPANLNVDVVEALAASMADDQHQLQQAHQEQQDQAQQQQQQQQNKDQC